ncbi:FAD-dependent oxidoreductase [Brackiella oedipodis]|uniref:FAD-dependent oxidoreductase n=1 Tax=Brackiella oedipodis TaxID=124225 RepID=UPI0004919351|nr:FAD-dependent oxidoreductase [Brackiella oedipodis]
MLSPLIAQNIDSAICLNTTLVIRQVQFQSCRQLLCQALEAYSQSAASKTAHNILIESDAGLLLLPILLQWHEQQVKAQDLHIMLALEQAPGNEFWQPFCEFLSQTCPSLLPVGCELQRRWALALPGVQRLDRLCQPNHALGTARRQSITVAYVEPQSMQKQWLANVDVYVRWQWQAETAIVPLYLKKARQQSALISNIDADGQALALLQSSGLKRRQHLRFESGDWQVHCQLLYSYRPPLCFNSQAQHKQMAIVGGGLAAAGIADAMAERGWSVTIYDPAYAANPAAMHAGHTAAAMTPFISADDDLKSRLSRAGIMRAHACWSELPASIIKQTGTLEINRQQGYGLALTQIIQDSSFPKEWVRVLSNTEAQALCGIDLQQAAVYWPYAWQINPQALISYLTQQPGIQRCAAKVLKLCLNPDQSVQLQSSEGCRTYAQVVLAAAHQSLTLLRHSGLDQNTAQHKKRPNASQGQSLLPKIAASLHVVGGQIMYVPKDECYTQLNMNIGAEGYVLPTDAHYVIGSTYERDQPQAPISEQAQALLLKKMPLLRFKTTPVLPYQGWSGSRAIVCDRLPVIAQVCQGLWMASAYGSHGLTWSRLAGDLLASALEDEPIPLERDLWQAIGLR